MQYQKIISKNYDLIGIGIGVFNLSLAALLHKVKIYNYKFFDQKKEFNWHPGMLLDNSKLQVHFLKDLASCVDPSNPYTFLAYLCNQNRLYQFLNCKKNFVSRREFNDYFKWASKRINGLQFNEKVIDVTFNTGMFNIITESGSYRSRHIVLGTGVKPYVPKNCLNFLSNHFFHNHELVHQIKNLDFPDKRIAIIGGGQSGAEVFDTLISLKKKPKEVTWVSKRINFKTLEDSCFDNEFYTPHYVDHFYKLPADLRAKKLESQRLTSDGITQEFADALYNKLYDLSYIDKEKIKLELIPHHNLTNVKKCENQYLITLLDQDLNVDVKRLVDIVILATGYQSNVLAYLNKFFPSAVNLHDFTINRDYSIEWEHTKTNKIFVQNGAKHSHGIADPNLSLASWRNAVIINSLLGEELYNTSTENYLVGRRIERNTNHVKILDEFNEAGYEATAHNF